MEQILLSYSLPKETVISLMILYENTKAVVHSSVGNINFFISGVLQRDT